MAIINRSMKIVICCSPNADKVNTGRCFYKKKQKNLSQNVVGRRTGQTVTCQAQTIPGLILTTRYICDCVTHTKLAITCACVFSTHLMFCFPSVVHMVCVCWGGSRHHTELQELQPGDSGCVWVWLRGGARQRRYWSWESAGKVRPAFTVTVTEG